MIDIWESYLEGVDTFVMGESRTKKSIRNVITGIGSKLFLMVLAFASKSIFVRLLGTEYNGINGLYTNLLSILSLAELGVGNVLTFSLYGALKNNDKELVATIISSFKKIYIGIAAAVAIIGCAFIPFLRFIINSSLPEDKLVLYYILYLMNSVASYLVIYKTMILTADQKSYISNLVSTGSMCFMYALQIIYLLIRKDFIGYLLIQVVCTICGNLVLSRIASKQYSYINDKSLIHIERFDKKGLFENIKATFIYKISGVLLSSTDNILISIMIGTVSVGFYSNYYMIISYVTQFITIFITGIMASIGNLNAENNKEKSYNFFLQICLVFEFIAVVVACCYWNCVQDFMRIWLGQENVQPMELVFAIVVNCYYTTAMNPVWMFRETMGLFKEVKYIVLVTAVMNIILSIGLGSIFGMPGILIATTVSRFCSQFWFEPKVLYNKKFDKKPMEFYLKKAKGVIVCCIAVAISHFFCSFLGHNLLFVILRAAISAIIAVLCVWIANFMTPEWNMLFARIKTQIKK